MQEKEINVSRENKRVRSRLTKIPYTPVLVMTAPHHIVQDDFGIQTLGMASRSLNNLASKELVPLPGLPLLKPKNKHITVG